MYVYIKTNIYKAKYKWKIKHWIQAIDTSYDRRYKTITFLVQDLS